MKIRRRTIQCTSNKPGSLREAADQLNAYFAANIPDMGYEAVPDLKHNKVDIYLKGNPVSEHYLESEIVEVNGYRFRKATDEDIRDPNMQLYVKEKYRRTTERQVAQTKQIREIFKKFDLV